MTTLLTATAAALLGITLAISASAQGAYPSQNITIVLPFGPGSGTDIVTRTIAQKLGESLCGKSQARRVHLAHGHQFDPRRQPCAAQGDAL